VSVRESQHSAVVADGRRRLVQPWQDRFRDPALTVLLALELCAIFLAAPLAAKGLPEARAVADVLVFAVLLVVVLLSQKWVAIVLIVLGLVATAASFLLSGELAPVAAIILRHAGGFLAFSALIGVVVHAVYAPGRITFHRLQGAIVIYLSFATVFASAYALIWELSPGAFANLVVKGSGPEEIGSMLYFSFTTLTTTGYGDIVAVDPFARSLANFESVLGQFFIAITVARLVTMELADRHR